MIAYESEVQGGESHIALIRGDLCPDCPAFHLGSFPNPNVDGSADGACTPPRTPCPHPVLVRVHTRCTAGDVFAADCRCREILDQSMRMIAEAGCGVILYLHNTSRGFEIDRTPAPAFDSEGNAVPAEQREEHSGRIVLHQELRSREGAQARSGAFCAPSVSADRFCPIWEFSVSGCSPTRRCTFPRSKASASRSSSRCRFRWRNARG